MVVFSEDENEERPHFALVHKDIDKSEPVVVRIHSECLTGDLLGSVRCDCGEQLHQSLKMITVKKGILIYLRQEGRGIGLINKLKAYNLQDEGYNTIDANIHLGFEADERDYALAIEILQQLSITTIDLITNNPEKIEAIDQSVIQLHSRIPLIIAPKPSNQSYLDVKKDQMGHLM
jgi:3,4-dihydroxy 2-butanone 4-phosphate synthase/GTP cyclohydrolase II